MAYDVGVLLGVKQVACGRTRGALIQVRLITCRTVVQTRKEDAGAYRGTKENCMQVFLQSCHIVPLASCRDGSFELALLRPLPSPDSVGRLQASFLHPVASRFLANRTLRHEGRNSLGMWLKGLRHNCQPQIERPLWECQHTAIQCSRQLR
jgi:hypothetical protein